MQERRNSSALAVELRLSCTNPLIWNLRNNLHLNFNCNSNCIIEAFDILYPSVCIHLRLEHCLRPIWWGWQHKAMLITGSPSGCVLWVNARQATSLTSFLTHLDHISLGFPRPLVQGITKYATKSIHEVACCTCPDHLSRWLWRTAIISLMSSLWSSEAEGLSSWSLDHGAVIAVVSEKYQPLLQGPLSSILIHRPLRGVAVILDIISQIYILSNSCKIAHRWMP